MASQLPELTGPQMQEATEPTETRRRKEERVVIRVRAGDRCGKEKGSGTPADSWSWRKYGQKPIKGSPYPRSYYRCSASKGCPAKKQVERCSTDASIVVVTYALDHNHPGPRLLHLSSICKAQEFDAIDEDQGEREAPRPQSPLVMLHSNCSNHQDTQEGKNCSEKQSSDVSIKREGDTIVSEAARMRREEDHFFDELGELPLSLLCSSVLSSNFFDERKLLLPF